MKYYTDVFSSISVSLPVWSPDLSIQSSSFKLVAKINSSEKNTMVKVTNYNFQKVFYSLLMLLLVFLSLVHFLRSLCGLDMCPSLHPIWTWIRTLWYLLWCTFNLNSFFYTSFQERKYTGILSRWMKLYVKHMRFLANIFILNWDTFNKYKQILN